MTVEMGPMKASTSATNSIEVKPTIRRMEE